MEESDAKFILIDVFPDMPDCYQASWEIIELFCGWNPVKKPEDLPDEK